MNKLKVAVIGVGHHGKYHVNKFITLPDVELVAVCDNNIAVCDEVAQKFNILAIYDYRQLVGKVEAVSIVVPTHLHCEIASFFLNQNIHVLLEKPITSTIAEAEQLIQLAKKNKLVLQVGHLERFNPALLALNGILNQPRFIESVRIAPFSLRATDVSVILDLMIHDLDIIQNIVRSPIHSIDASGAQVLSNEIDIINARIRFENKCVANLTASRVSIRKQRLMRIFQHDAYVNIDFNDKRIAIHRKGSAPMFPGLSDIPEILREEKSFAQGDALLHEITDYVNAVITQQQPTVSGEDGKRALETALKITKMVQEELAELNV